MKNKFSDFLFQGVDVSQNNGAINWRTMAIAGGVDFSAIRLGYGKKTDGQFSLNWKNAKGNVIRIPYWYMDYYSNHNVGTDVCGMSDEEWGKNQAEYCWNLIKEDNDNTIVFLDIESTSIKYAPEVTAVPDRVHRIAKAFLETIDSLNGKINGIYTSLGLLAWFPEQLRSRPLWLAAWFTTQVSIQYVLNTVKIKKWTGQCLIWQFATGGDINGDGISDSNSIGCTSKNLDLDGWIGSKNDYENFIGKPIPEPPEEKEIFKVKVLIPNLNIRVGPGKSYAIAGMCVLNTVYPVYSENGYWLKIGNKQWIYGISSYAQKITTPDIPTGGISMKLYYPLPEGIKITQKFGVNPQWYPQSKGHNGIDWGCITGTKIYAMQDGKVIRADAYSGKTGYGRHVRIQHKDGVSIYGHLSVIYVSVGQEVKAQQLIGLSGGATTDPASGNSTGPHLHAEYRLDNVSNPAPGGYKYNAIDILPLLISHDSSAPPEPQGLHRINVNKLNIRSTPNSAINTNIIGALYYGNIVSVSETQNGWGKLADREGWIYLYYTVKL